MTTDDHGEGKPFRVGDILRAFGRDWILTTLGLYDATDLDSPAPDSAPPVPVDSERGREYGE